MMKIPKNNLSIILLLFFFSAFSYAQIIRVDSSKLPVINTPDFKDLVFRQFQEDADYNNRIFPDHKTFDKNGNEKKLILSFYKVNVPQNMDFLWFSSRMSPVYADTTATLNRIGSADSSISGKTLLVSSFSGLFIPQKPQTAWEQMLYKQCITDGSINDSLFFEIDGQLFYFFERNRFDATTYLFFKDVNMSSPLESNVLTSDFGYRISPINGKWKFHSGVDLASPLGSKVFACKAGEITQTGFNSTYGNFIIIQHYNNMTSLYAHLSEILVEKGQKVNGRTLIGKSGSTGASTGPHLHFELRKDGSPTDPGKLINW